MTGIARCTEEHYHDGERVTVGGLITGVRIRSTKKGERMATFMLEDLTGSIGVIAFPRTYGECRSQIEEDQPVAITGMLKFDEEPPRLFANRIEPLREREKEIHLFIGKGRNTPDVQAQLGAIFSAFHGKNPVYLHVEETRQVIRTRPQFWVDGKAPGFTDAIKRVLGEEGLR